MAKIDAMSVDLEGLDAGELAELEAELAGLEDNEEAG
jgi:hypothetical protein